jgi:hypothetical protein
MLTRYTPIAAIKYEINCQNENQTDVYSLNSPKTNAFIRIHQFISEFLRYYRWQIETLWQAISVRQNNDKFKGISARNKYFLDRLSPQWGDCHILLAFFGDVLRHRDTDISRRYDNHDSVDCHPCIMHVIKINIYPFC